MNNLQNTSPERAEENHDGQSLQSSSYECRNLADGSVTQTLEVEGWISRGWNCFRPADQWRAAVRIGERMEWQWCDSEYQAIAWVQSRLPRGYIPNADVLATAGEKSPTTESND
jgi:hypothetical protein